MEKFLDPNDLNFYQTRKQTDQIIHYVHSFNSLGVHGLNKQIDYSLIEYLDCGYYIKLFDLSKLINLKILIYHCSKYNLINISNIQLPNLTILIFKNAPLVVIKTIKNIFFDNNLPITLNKIIFDNIIEINLDNDNQVNEYLKNIMSSVKIPFGCEIYYIDTNKEIFLVK